MEQTTFCITAPSEGAKEVAVETRNHWEAVIAGLRDSGALDPRPVQVLSKEELKELKQDGGIHFQEQLEQLHLRAKNVQDAHPAFFVHTAVALARDVLGLCGEPKGPATLRERLAMYEGVVQAAKKALFRADQEYTGSADRAVWGLLGLEWPVYTTSSEDQEVLGVLGLAPCGAGTPARWNSHAVWEVEAGALQGVVNGTCHNDAAPRVYSQVFLYNEGPEWYACGMLSPEDVRDLRWRTVPVGRWLKEQTQWSDTRIRVEVERLKTRTGTAQFEILPNDVDCTDVYQAGPKSCMSNWNYADDWTPKGLHPASAYSSAYHGCGDNHLALIVARNSSGEAVGRGWYNCLTQQVVRWYGCHSALRELKRLEFKFNPEALKGSWLALIEDYKGRGRRSVFLYPYVDGEYCCGIIKGGRVVLTDEYPDDAVGLQDTDGYSYTPTQEDEDD